jgi:pyridoxal 5-phosphate dependent beta-lyase
MDRDLLAPGESPVLLLESHEAHIAGRIGLCAAVAEHVALEPAQVRSRLAAVGQLTREALADVPGWEVVEAPEGSAGGCAITALRPTAGQKVAAVRALLLAEHQIVTTAAVTARAPREMKEPYLRISPHVDVTPEDLAMLRRALPASLPAPLRSSLPAAAGRVVASVVASGGWPGCRLRGHPATACG